MPEYRPCIATERKTKCVPSKEPTQRILDAKQDLIEHKALFHYWSQKSWVYSPVMIGEVGGQISSTVAIVEYEDETIHEHLPQEIQFTDGKAEKISENKKDEWSKLTDDTDSYPEPYENILFKTSDGRIYYGFCDIDRDWQVDFGDEQAMLICDVVEWRKVQL